MTNPRHTTLSPQCEFLAAATSDLHFDSVQTLGEKYRTPETKILYFVAPVPSCGNAASVVNRSYSELPAAPPKELPTEMFSGEVMYLHPHASSVPAITQNLIEAVRPVLANSAR